MRALALRLKALAGLPFAAGDVAAFAPAPEPAVSPAAPESKAARLPKRSFSGYATLFETPRLNLEPWLQEHGYATEKLPKNAGGALLTFGRAVVDTGGMGVGGESFGYGQGHLGLGYMLARTRFFRVYPLITVGGVGAGGKSSTPQPGEAGDTAPATGVGAAIFTVGLGVDFTLKLWRLGLVVGVRAGYQLAFGSSEGGDGQGHLPPSGPFFRVIAGPGLLL